MDYAQAIADLRQTKEVLEADGWTTGTWICADGKRCFTGALTWVTSNETTNNPNDLYDAPSSPNLERFYDALGVLGLWLKDPAEWDNGSRAVRWNDSVAGTIENVLAGIDAAINIGKERLDEIE